MYFLVGIPQYRYQHNVKNEFFNIRFSYSVERNATVVSVCTTIPWNNLGGNEEKNLSAIKKEEKEEKERKKENKKQGALFRKKGTYIFIHVETV